MKKRLLQGGAFALGVGLSAAAFAQGNVPPAQRMDAQDAHFVDDAAIGGQFEVEAGKLAEHNAASQQVRSFGARMVRDHSAADARLKQVLAREGDKAPHGLDQKHAQLRDRLASLKGADFDREYMHTMVEDHDQDAQAFANEAHSAKDPGVRRFAETTLPVIRQHDKLAHDVAATLTASGSTTPPRR